MGVYSWIASWKYQQQLFSKIGATLFPNKKRFTKWLPGPFMLVVVSRRSILFSNFSYITNHTLRGASIFYVDCPMGRGRGFSKNKYHTTYIKYIFRWKMRRRNKILSGRESGYFETFLEEINCCTGNLKIKKLPEKVVK